MRPTWGPSRADRTQVGPMLAPRTLLSGEMSPGFETYSIYSTSTYQNGIYSFIGALMSSWVRTCLSHAQNNLCDYLCIPLHKLTVSVKVAPVCILYPWSILFFPGSTITDILSKVRAWTSWKWMYYIILLSLQIASYQFHNITPVNIYQMIIKNGHAQQISAWSSSLRWACWGCCHSLNFLL